MAKSKACTKCGETKPLSEFHKNKAHRDGHATICKECRSRIGYERRARERPPEEILPSGFKRCSVCRGVKPLDEFPKATACKDGHRGKCKVCQSEYGAEWYTKNRDSLRRGMANAHLQRKYGITLTDYDALLEAQGNACAICDRTVEEEGRRLAVDHDHETGEIRGLLCYNCNRGIGHLQDNPDLLRAAAEYLEWF